MRWTILLLLFASIGSANAAPSRIVLLRHGEKENAYALCDIGQQRSLALRAQYLGKGAEHSIFDPQPPSAFFATTLHTLELAAPAADSWGLPVTTYSVVPIPEQDSQEETDWITRQTQLASSDIMNSPAWRNKTVVIVWEHKHIANHKLAKENPDSSVELRQLLKLDQLPNKYISLVPKTWSGTNYNFFWIIDYDAAGQPVAFNTVQQTFTGKYSTLPNNQWGAPEELPAHSRCER